MAVKSRPFLFDDLSPNVSMSNTMVSIVDQELLFCPEQSSSSPVFSYVCCWNLSFQCSVYMDCYLFIRPFFFGHCIIYPPLIYPFQLLFWYLPTFLAVNSFNLNFAVGFRQLFYILRSIH